MTSAAILINYNDKSHTIKYARELQSFNVFNKILIVDNCSPDEHDFSDIQREFKEYAVVNEQAYLLELSHSQGVLGTTIIEVIKSDKNGGYNYAINFGIRYLESKGENYTFYMISNTDIVIREKAVKACLQELQNNPKTAVVAPRMRNMTGNYIRRDCWKERTYKLDVIHSTRLLEALFYGKLRDAEYKEEDFMYLKDDKRLKVECISGSLFFIKSSVVKEMNYFDDNVFLFYEEDILYKKLQKLNPEYETICLGNYDFTHLESQSIGKSLNYYKKMKQLYNSKMYYHKTYNNITKWQIASYVLLWGCRQFEILFEIPVRKLMELIEEKFY